MCPKLAVYREQDKTWWIRGLVDPIGPYKTAAEAKEAKEGLQRFYETELGRRPRIKRE